MADLQQTCFTDPDGWFFFCSFAAILGMYTLMSNKQYYDAICSGNITNTEGINSEWLRGLPSKGRRGCLQQRGIKFLALRVATRPPALPAGVKEPEKSLLPGRPPLLHEKQSRGKFSLSQVMAGRF